MHGQDRAAPGHPEAGRHATTHHQRPDEARACRVGDRVRPFDAGLPQHGPDQRQQHAHVVARGDLRHDAAVHGVRVHLAVQRVRQQAFAAAVQRHTGLVTAGFDAQNVHQRQILPFLALLTLCKWPIRGYYKGLLPAMCRDYLCPTGIAEQCQVFA